MSDTTATDDRLRHREFLNRYYGISRHFYDLTRKYYLFGRDDALRELLRERWSTVIEVGVGTGRNLRKLHQQRPEARFGGVDASDAMLTHVREKSPWVKTLHGFAEDVDFSLVHGEKPERILFSYCLSMVSDAPAALANARRALAPGGKVVVVDFADLKGLPAPAARALRAWLKAFHVCPLDTDILDAAGAAVRFGPARYYQIGVIEAES